MMGLVLDMTGLQILLKAVASNPAAVKVYFDSLGTDEVSLKPSMKTWIDIGADTTHMTGLLLLRALVPDPAAVKVYPNRVEADEVSLKVSMRFCDIPEFGSRTAALSVALHALCCCPC